MPDQLTWGAVVHPNIYQDYAISMFLEGTLAGLTSATSINVGLALADDAPTTATDIIAVKESLKNETTLELYTEVTDAP